MSHPIIVTVTGQTVDEIREKLIKYAREFGHDEKQELLPLQTPSAPAVSAELLSRYEAPLPKEEAAKDEPAKEEKRGRHVKNCPCEKCAGKKNEAPAAVSAEPQKEVKVPEPKAEAQKAKSVSKDDVMAALQELQSKVHLKAVIAALGKYGAKKASEVKESDYAAIVDHCKSVIASNSAELNA